MSFQKVSPMLGLNGDTVLLKRGADWRTIGKIEFAGNNYVVTYTCVTTPFTRSYVDDCLYSWIHSKKNTLRQPSASGGQVASVTTKFEGDSDADIVATNVRKVRSLLAWCLPRKLHDISYFPCSQDLLEEFLLAQKACRTTVAHIQLSIFFWLRADWQVVQSLTAWLANKVCMVVRWTMLSLLGGKVVTDLRCWLFHMFGKF